MHIFIKIFSYVMLVALMWPNAAHAELMTLRERKMQRWDRILAERAQEKQGWEDVSRIRSALEDSQVRTAELEKELRNIKNVLEESRAERARMVQQVYGAAKPTRVENKATKALQQKAAKDSVGKTWPKVIRVRDPRTNTLRTVITRDAQMASRDGRRRADKRHTD